MTYDSKKTKRKKCTGQFLKARLKMMYFSERKWNTFAVSILWIIYVSTDWFAYWEFRNFLNSRKSTDAFLSIRARIRKYLVYFCMQRRFFFMLSFNHFTVMLVWIYLHLTFLIPHFHLTHLYSYVLWINNGATFVNRKGNTDCCGKAN